MKKIKSLCVVLVAIISLLCSYNTYALSDVGIFKSSHQITNLTAYSGNISKHDDMYFALGSVYAPTFHTNNAFDYEKGDIITFSYYILDNTDYDRMANPSSPPSCLGSGYWLTIIDCNMQMGFVSELQGGSNFVFSINGAELGSYNPNSHTISINNITYYVDSSQFNFTPYHFYYFQYTVRTNYNRNGVTTLDFQNNLVNINANTASNDYSFIFPARNFQLFSGSATVQDVLDYLKEHPDNTAQVLEQQRDDDKQEMQSTQSDASSDGSDSEQQATSQGQTLLQAFISFINAITSASPSNCNLNMDTGFINFGSVNLCALSPPPAFQVISSIVVIGFAVPLSLSASKKMIELFRSFQT